ncbi:MAG: hypothetical protein GXP43_03220 [bacterium]|nr:hypothetical protein [bacterium]
MLADRLKRTSPAPEVINATEDPKKRVGWGMSPITVVHPGSVERWIKFGPTIREQNQPGLLPLLCHVYVLPKQTIEEVVAYFQKMFGPTTGDRKAEEFVNELLNGAVSNQARIIVVNSLRPKDDNRAGKELLRSIYPLLSSSVYP